MPNPEHLAIVKQGVEVWNKWRRQNPQVNPDLSESSPPYQGNLQWAHLDNFDFSSTEFGWCNLTMAQLSGANLTSALFQCAYLHFTNLQGAILRSANLQMTHLIWTHLQEADLAGATLGNTVFADADLSQTKGLANIEHTGPSSIDIRTIVRSGGSIPDVFLRGCGLPEPIIEFTHSLVSNPAQFPSTFISYSTSDEEFSRRLYADLLANGVPVWYAPEEMKTGAVIRDALFEAVRLHDKLLLILSENSIDSPWVEDEVESAYEKERQLKAKGEPNPTVLFPIRLDDSMRDTTKAWAAKLRQQRHVTNFTGWKDHDQYRKAFDRLLRDLKTSPV